MTTWLYEEFSTVSKRAKSLPSNIFSPPELRIPILYGRNCLSARECKNLRDLILRKEEIILKESLAVPIAGLQEGITTRWLSYNLFKWEEKEVLPLKRMVEEGYKVFLKTSKQSRWKNSAQCWANVLRSGQRLSTHMHNYLPRTTINGTVALTKNDTETVFVFPFPLVAKFKKTEHQQFALPTTLGHMIIIPGWLAHFTSPVPDNQTRITLGFDIADGLRKGEFIPFDDLSSSKRWPAFK